MKLILFDIDGTLIHVNRDVTIRVVDNILKEILQHDGGLPERHEFHGKTDKQIFHELCEIIGHNRDAANGFVPKMEEALVRNWQAELTPEVITILPGIPELLDRLANRDDIALGLLTGNLAASAQLKLQPHNLFRHFGFGAYGSDSHHRNDLPPIALERAGKLHSRTFAPDQVLIIGDSHRDIACAKAWNIRCLAVSTGSLTSDVLRSYEPDGLCETLEDQTYIDYFLES